MVVRGRSDRYTQDVFRSLGGRAEALVAELTRRELSLPPNRVLIGEGEVGAALYRIDRGWAFRQRSVGEGSGSGAGNRRRQIVDFLMPGEIAGLQTALFGESEHSVLSLTPLRASHLEARLVGEAFRGEPELALRLARFVAAEASRVEEMLTVIGCCDALERLAFLMVSLYRRQARRERIDPHDVPFPLRRQHMADALGLTGAHINRTLNRLRQDAIATVENNRLAIHDLARLEALAGVATTAA